MIASAMGVAAGSTGAAAEPLSDPPWSLAFGETLPALQTPSRYEKNVVRALSNPNGEFRMPAFPVRFDGAPAPVKPAPLLGEHTAEVFGEWLGISTVDLEAMRNDGIV